MLHALLPAYIHRQSDEHLLELIQACELALLDGTSTHGDMTTLVECEKEMLQREHARVRRTIAGIRPEDFVSPKTSLSSLAEKHPVQLPAEYATDPGSPRSDSQPNQGVTAARTGRRSRPESEAKPVPHRTENEPEKFNFKRAIVSRFRARKPAEQIAAGRAQAQPPHPKASAAQPPRASSEAVRGSHSAKPQAGPVPAHVDRPKVGRAARALKRELQSS